MCMCSLSGKSADVVATPSSNVPLAHTQTQVNTGTTTSTTTPASVLSNKYVTDTTTSPMSMISSVAATMASSMNTDRHSSIVSSSTSSSTHRNSARQRHTMHLITAKPVVTGTTGSPGQLFYNLQSPRAPIESTGVEVSTGAVVIE